MADAAAPAPAAPASAAPAAAPAAPAAVAKPAAPSRSTTALLLSVLQLGLVLGLFYVAMKEAYRIRLYAIEVRVSSAAWRALSAAACCSGSPPPSRAER